MYGDHGCGIDIYNMFYENKDILSNDINDMLEEEMNIKSLLKEECYLKYHLLSMMVVKQQNFL